MDTYVSPMSLQNTSIPGLDFIPWPRIGTGDLIDNMGTGTSQSVVLASPALSYEPLVGTPEGGFSDSDLAAFMDLPDMTQQQSRLQEPTQPGYGTQGTEFGESSSHSKHTKKSAKQDVAAARSLPSGSNRRLAAAATVIVPENINTADSRGKTKLRSASRSSKNIQIRFAETVEERKTRNSHNLVEKQYRNRLNAQFESLLNTLPDAVRSPESSSGPGNLDPAFDFGDKKLSKGEVLDLSMRYIRALERDCGRLEREREELKRTVNELQGAVRDSCMSGPDGSGGGSGAVLR
ncbi:hypothetical protein B0T25DRAFT_158854 [Lasiosphaeria hispida]|uniref:BHLH domain-containing protein n=1 Tax=Lasiosphaeria hispida TaxID=260671 RepID=A0AAJ0HMF5_9PEZI|nr:hypothetical protein B0T25DRAFT_158854 [Lasiosphaeria hispida]